MDFPARNHFGGSAQQCGKAAIPIPVEGKHSVQHSLWATFTKPLFKYTTTSAESWERPKKAQLNTVWQQVSVNQPPNTATAHARSLTQVTLLLPGANNAHAITINSWWTVTCLCIWNGGCFWKSHHVHTYILRAPQLLFQPSRVMPTCFFPCFQAAAVRSCDLCYFHVLHHSEKSPEALPRCFKNWPPARTGLNTHPDIRHTTYSNSSHCQLAFRWICSDFKLWIGVTHNSACDNRWCQEANVTSGFQLRTRQQPRWHISLSKMDSQGWANSPSLLPATSQLQSTGHATSCRETNRSGICTFEKCSSDNKKRPISEVPSRRAILQALPARETINTYYSKPGVLLSAIMCRKTADANCLYIFGLGRTSQILCSVI